MRSFQKAMPHSVDMVIPGFEKSYPQGIFRTLAPSQRDSAEWYREFVNRLETAVRRRYLPVCRLSDGEFVFTLGKSYPAIRGSNENLRRYLKRLCYSYVSRLLNPASRQFGDGVGFHVPTGVYSVAEWREARSLYMDQLREISKHGILALHFSYRDNQFAQQYFVPMVKRLRQGGITLSDRNYYPFYFVYALLNGPDRSRILGRERILVVTHCDQDKARRIEGNLKAEGARDVQFLQISTNRSMYDVLDLRAVRMPVDVVLVGAGIGKPNILLQLQTTNTLCIDAGFGIECIAYPEYRRSRAGARTFTWPDNERNGDFSAL